MVYIERWKILLIIGVCLLALVTAAPNVMGADARAWVAKHAPFLPHETVNLGLDLRGGSYLLLEVAVDAVAEERAQGLVDQVRGELRSNKIGYSTPPSVANGGVRFKLTDPSLTDKVKDILRKMDPELEMSASDGEFTVRFSQAQVLARKQSALDQSIEIVRRRIDETGTREPSIQRQGENRIIVELPGVDDPDRIKKLIGQTAKLTFQMVDENANTTNPPAGTVVLPLTEYAGQSLVVEKRIMVSGETLIDAQPSFDEFGKPSVSFRFDSAGGKRFGEATRTNVGHIFAIVLDNKIISAPRIQTPILGGSGQITGNFTTQSAQDLALLLRAGALPAPIKILEQRTVGPGLGSDSIKAGAVASIIGLCLVMAFFILSYGLFGIFGNIALLFNIAIIFASLSLLQATLTLPGIAGIVLTIGTALDANILVFERIREEIRNGRSPVSAIDAGYKHALSAIVDANMTALIAAFLLFMFGTGPIKGFAVTLSIGIMASIFSAMMTARLIVVWWLRTFKPKEIPI